MATTSRRPRGSIQNENTCRSNAITDDSLVLEWRIFAMRCEILRVLSRKLPARVCLMYDFLAREFAQQLSNNRKTISINLNRFSSVGNHSLKFP